VLQFFITGIEVPIIKQPVLTPKKGGDVKTVHENPDVVININFNVSIN